MLLNLVCGVVGVAGVLVLILGPGVNYFSPESVATALPVLELDFVVDVATLSVGEPIWSTFTLEVLRLVVFTTCFLTILALIGEFGEKRILAFLIMMEVLLVFLAVLLVLSGASAGFNTAAYYNTALCILAAGGADTALALALFMTYFKVTGRTTLK